MTKSRLDNAALKKTRMARPSSGAVLGLQAFEKISAIEGISLTDEMRKDLAQIENARLDDAQCSRLIFERYGKV